MIENIEEVNMFSPLKIGEKVPDFEFEIFSPKDDTTKKVKISDYKGKWLILFFYPADFTFVCPTELEEMAELYSKFKEEGAEVISVSTDTVFVHKAWHEDSPAISKIKFPMASDANHDLSNAFGVLIEEEGVALRGTFLIDPEGKIMISEIHNNSVGRNAHELLRKLQASKFIEENNGKVCPASWKPGDDTLTPGLDLVGKI